MMSLSGQAIGYKGTRGYDANKVKKASRHLRSAVKVTGYVNRKTYVSYSMCKGGVSVPNKQGTCSWSKRNLVKVTAGAAIAETESDTKPTVVIAGAGIGGLVLAVGLLKEGFKVTVLERDLTAIRGEGKYRGPIQVQSNALAALQAIDEDVAEKVINSGCITGDRVNGLCDGVSGDWYCKFDTFHPAVERGLPVTRVISRQVLQEILAERAREIGGENIITNDVRIVDYKETVDEVSGKKVVHAIADDGREWVGDVLVGADGIWSKVRTKMIGHTEANYSQYTCYTGISDFTPPDIDTVGYRVFLGNEQYFVSSDVGGGKMQWYGFHREPSGGDDPPGRRKERLMEIFGDWNEMVTDLIMATPEEDVLRRDIFDRPPIFKWNEGRVVLLGDSAHAMQPNLGQGGCMAIEDAFQLTVDLIEETTKAQDAKTAPNIDGVLSGYFRKRLLRASAIHGMAGMAAFMASTYKAYLGEGLGPLEWLTKFKIPHPGRVSGQIILKLTMPAVLEWVLGGYQSTLEKAGRIPVCRIEDKPQGFDEADFPLFMRDDDALLRAANANWSVSQRGGKADILIEDKPLCLSYGNIITSVNDEGSADALIRKVGQDYFIKDLGKLPNVMMNDRPMPANVELRLRPGDEISIRDNGPIFSIKLQHKSVTEGGHGKYDRKHVNVEHPELSMS